jgi:hypothetical protein
MDIKRFFEKYDLTYKVISWLNNSKVFYTNTEQIEFVKSNIIGRLDGFEKITGIKLEKAEQFFGSIFILIYCHILAEITPVFKHLGFSDENEYRVYLEEGQAEADCYHFKSNAKIADVKINESMLNISNNIYTAAKTLNVLKKNKKYGVFNNGIKSYYAMNLSEIWGESLIKEIIIGPKCFQNKNELIDFIRDNGLNGTKVLVSKIPIR